MHAYCSVASSLVLQLRGPHFRRWPWWSRRSSMAVTAALVPTAPTPYLRRSFGDGALCCCRGLAQCRSVRSNWEPQAQHRLLAIHPPRAVFTPSGVRVAYSREAGFWICGKTTASSTADHQLPKSRLSDHSPWLCAGKLLLLQGQPCHGISFPPRKIGRSEGLRHQGRRAL